MNTLKWLHPFLRNGLVLTMIASASTGHGQALETKAELGNPLATEPTGSQATRSVQREFIRAESPDALQQATEWKREAISAAKEVVATFPDVAVSQALLGSAYFNIGQSEEAVEHLHRCLEMDPSQIDAYEILARIAYDKGDLDESIRLCEAALERAGSHPMILNRLGRAWLDLGRTEEAIRVLQPILESEWITSEGLYLLGQAYLQGGNPKQAHESFERAIQWMPEHTQSYFGLFTSAMRLGQQEAALRYREQFLALEAKDRQQLTDRSSQKDTLSGLPLVRQTVARTFFGAAQIHLLHQQTQKAEGLFHKAATIDPDHEPSRSALESLMIKRNAVLEAIQTFEQLASAQPDNSLNYLFLGRFEERRKQMDAAEQAFQKAIELARDNPEGYRSLIELYFKSNQKFSEAKALAERLIELEPNHGPNYYLLAFGHVKTNNRQGALQAMERAVELTPNNTRFQQLLQQLKGAP